MPAADAERFVIISSMFIAGVFVDQMLPGQSERDPCS